jgi:hypothetical protein
VLQELTDGVVLALRNCSHIGRIRKYCTCGARSRPEILLQYLHITVPVLATVPMAQLFSGFHRAVDEMCALLGYYSALSGSSVLTFRDNLSAPSGRVKKSREVWGLVVYMRMDKTVLIVVTHSSRFEAGTLFMKCD